MNRQNETRTQALRNTRSSRPKEDTDHSSMEEVSCNSCHKSYFHDSIERKGQKINGVFTLVDCQISCEQAVENHIAVPS